ncbi:hypothetical protein B0H15DRAFT_838468 [Mycena belliarum]|uniref:WD40 repeat-like protein n=1 Tax=Mycena belliarum TaxID=1033014 RepID=A0AAD6UA10_9AGAR|nr:hypothetical protein B0H15DRAFT_838468 [Mycena belliae]
MHDSSITVTDSLSPNVSVSSALGIKGGLRIRPHTINQKAHAILRRAEASGDSTDDEDESDVVCFRLFAHKHINLKPGKELLLTVATVDGRFKERILMFEGNLKGFDETSDPEGTTQVEEEPQVIEEEEDMIPQAAIPPKMRRQWTRKLEEVSPVILRTPVARASAGVQAQPIYVSSAVQACSEHSSLSIQLQPSYTSSAVQADPLPLPSYASLDIQTDPIIPSSDLASVPHITDAESQHGTSLSPMLLSSSGSPVIPPLFFRQGKLQDMSLSPMRVKLEELEQNIPPSSEVSVQINQPVKEETIEVLLEHPPPRRPHFVTDVFALDNPERPPSPMSPPPPTPRNPIVSGGSVTSFLGTAILPAEDALPLVSMDEPERILQAAADPTPKPYTDAKHRRRLKNKARLGAEAQAAAQCSYIVDGPESSGVKATGGRDPPNPYSTPAGEWTSPVYPILSSPQTLRLSSRALQATTQGAVASSSKVTPRASSVVSASVVSLATTTTSNRTTEKASNTATKQPHRRDVDVSPPDLKAIACIPAGPSSNPLSIRPSSASYPTVLPSALVRPKVAAAAAATTKKRVVVGRGWPIVRTVAATTSAVPNTNTSQAPTKSSTNSRDLSGVLGYASPSPPPASVPANKWKRIDSDFSIAVQPRNDLPVDMVMSPPPSPIADKNSANNEGVSALISLKDRISMAESSRFQDRILPINSDYSAKGQTGASVAFTLFAGSSEKSPIVANTRKYGTQLSAFHPLPAKPPCSNNDTADSLRGIKRERLASPDLWTAPGIMRIQHERRKHRWPTIKPSYAVLLKGDGDLGIRRIAFSSDGAYLAMYCWDRTLRIWSTKVRLEVARLSHNAQVIGIAWVDNETAVMTLGEDGVLAKWTRGQQREQWEWGRLVNVSAEKGEPGDTVCLACARGRIAVAFPKSGVKVWKWHNGTWLAQRSIMRTNVTALKFVEGGDALLGGTREGAVWHCAVPNGTMRVYAFIQSSITSIDINPTGTHALITQASGSACIVALGAQEERRVVRSYLEQEVRDGVPGGIFATEGQAVVFGALEGCLLVWDTQKGVVVYGMQHAEGDLIQAAASCSGPDGCVVTGTREGRLVWWPQPTEQAHGPPNGSRKRAKVK